MGIFYIVNTPPPHLPKLLIMSEKKFYKFKLFRLNCGKSAFDKLCSGDFLNLKKVV